jgi:hypothetical protein
VERPFEHRDETDKTTGPTRATGRTVHRAAAHGVATAVIALFLLGASIRPAAAEHKALREDLPTISPPARRSWTSSSTAAPRSGERSRRSTTCKSRNRCGAA